MTNYEEQYLTVLRNCLQSQCCKENRTGVGRLTIPPQFFQYDMSNGFPLLTTKKMPLRTIAVELEGFIGGITDKRWYQERNCFIWQEWANPKQCDKIAESLGVSRESDEYKDVMKLCNDLGPIYGSQSRCFGPAIESPVSSKVEPRFYDPRDQLARAYVSLKEDKSCTRAIVSHWNPTVLSEQALPPCHYSYMFNVVDDKLCLTWTQRSADWFLGVPFNIASYALLLNLMARDLEMEPYILTGIFIDTHMYENHKEQAEEQLSREIRKPPEVYFTHEGNLFQWTHKDLVIGGYDPHPKIKAPVAV